MLFQDLCYFSPSLTHLCTFTLSFFFLFACHPCFATNPSGILRFITLQYQKEQLHKQVFNLSTGTDLFIVFRGKFPMANRGSADAFLTSIPFSQPSFSSCTKGKDL